MNNFINIKYKYNEISYKAILLEEHYRRTSMRSIYLVVRVVKTRGNNVNMNFEILMVFM